MNFLAINSAYTLLQFLVLPSFLGSYKFPFSENRKSLRHFLFLSFLALNGPIRGYDARENQFLRFF